jgi:hypothetical protein
MFSSFGSSIISKSQNILSSCVNNIKKNVVLFKQHDQFKAILNDTQTRSFGYKGRMMLKDIKRRELLKDTAPERIRLQTLRANSILPKAFRV